MSRLKFVAFGLSLFVGMGVIGFGVAHFTAKPTVRADANHTVNLLSDHADPSAIAITKGDYVQFNSKDGQTHNIGQGSGYDEVHQADRQDIHDHPKGAMESGDFGAKEGYRAQFNKVGTYEFHDHLHPKISVTVIVYEHKK